MEIRCPIDHLKVVLEMLRYDDAVCAATPEGPPLCTAVRDCAKGSYDDPSSFSRPHMRARRCGEVFDDL